MTDSEPRAYNEYKSMQRRFLLQTGKTFDLHSTVFSCANIDLLPFSTFALKLLKSWCNKSFTALKFV